MGLEETLAVTAALLRIR